MIQIKRSNCRNTKKRYSDHNAESEWRDKGGEKTDFERKSGQVLKDK